MRADAAIILWTPARYVGGLQGIFPGPRVAVLPYNQRGTHEARTYRMWGPAWGDKPGGAKGTPDAEAKRLATLFINFHTLTVRDGIPVEMAHRAFLAIDEYREHISPDILGAE
jgi:hypothetical protein